MSDYKRFMDRSCGRWVSHRRYLFGRKLTSGEYVTEFNIELKDGNVYSVDWSGQTEGTMDLVLDGDELKRSRTYFDADDGSTYQKMATIDDDAIVFVPVTMAPVIVRKFVSLVTTSVFAKT